MRSWQIIAGLLAAMASVAAMISLFFQVHHPLRQIDCAVFASTERTSVQQVPFLTADFKYKGRPVDHLWQLTLELTNTGEETIVGRGSKSSLIGDGLDILFDKRVNILSHDVSHGDLPIDVIDMPLNSPGSAVDAPKERLRLHFAQWRPKERVVIEIYMIPIETIVDQILPRVEEREVVDGDIVVKDRRIQSNPTPRGMISNFPKYLIAPAKWVAVVFLGIIAFAFVAVDIIAIVENTKQYMWKKRYGERYVAFVESMNNHDVEESHRFKYTFDNQDVEKINNMRLDLKKNPRKMIEDVRTKANIPAPPSVPDIEGGLQLLIALPICLGLSLALGLGAMLLAGW